MAKARNPNKKTVRDYENEALQGYTSEFGNYNTRNADLAMDEYEDNIPEEDRSPYAREKVRDNIRYRHNVPTVNKGTSLRDLRRLSDDQKDGIKKGTFTQEELNEAVERFTQEADNKRRRKEVLERGGLETQSIPSRDYSNRVNKDRVEQYQRNVAKKKSLVKMIVDQQKQIKSLVRKYNQLKSIIG